MVGTSTGCINRLFFVLLEYFSYILEDIYTMMGNIQLRKIMLKR